MDSVNSAVTAAPLFLFSFEDCPVNSSPLHQILVLRKAREKGTNSGEIGDIHSHFPGDSDRTAHTISSQPSMQGISVVTR